MRSLSVISARWPIYVALIPVFFIWHKLNENFGLIPIKTGLSLLPYYGTIALSIFLVGRTLSFSWRAAGLLSAMWLVIFLFWAPIHDFIKSIRLPGLFSSYTFLFVLISLLSVALLFWLRRKRPVLLQATRYLNALLLLLIMLEVFTTLYDLSTGQRDKMQLGYGLAPLPDDKNHPGPDSSLPDIFLVVFDEYASSRSLKQYVDFDNSRLDSLLRARGFYVADSSSSNYNSTPHSLASLLTLRYFPKDLEGAPSDPRGMLLAQQAYRHAPLPNWLADRGYRIRNFGLMDLQSAPARAESYFNRDLKASFTHENLPRRVHMEIWWKLVTWFPALNVGSDNWKEIQKKELDLFRQNWTSLEREWSDTAAGPRLVIGHFMLPHHPFNLDRNGIRRDLHSFDKSRWRDSLYLDQLMYANQLIDTLTRQMEGVSDRPRVLIIMGDHGFRDNEQPIEQRIRPKQFQNLTAIYFSDRDYERLYPSITPVNGMRMVFNKYFGFSLPLLADSSIMLR